MSPRIAVIGIGNVLTGDDAVGPHVVRVFEARHAVPPDVQVMDAGTPGYDLTAFIAGLEGLVLVDAVKAKAAPGTLRVYDKEELLHKAPVLAMSPHEPGVREALMNAEFMGVSPKTVKLVGVVPASVATGIGLSPEVRAAIDGAVAQVAKELAALGVAVTERVPPAAPDLWWEKPRG
ncbi:MULTISPECIES: hydrogenase maturation protease [unclassified Anaeromyxobacter]|uniref:hydrogenase maturation protease n=1 Tax=unclassified Anaeromyxobacter TaxID=2620896 RepID=UPI001F5863F9|nr:MULTISPECIES: hydrogenase maturation protease [unclassified Anaeromyxobacter]